MARSSDVVKKVMRFKLQLTDTADSATVLKVLEKLKDLDITLEILSETGIGKTVNSLRRHKQVGEFAKSLVKGWKKLVPKESISNTEDRDVSQSLSVRDISGSLTMEDLNNNRLTSPSESLDSSEEAPFEMGKRKIDSDRQCGDQERKMDQIENKKKDQQENQNIFQSEELMSKIKILDGKLDDSVSKKKKNDYSDKKSRDRDSCHGNKKFEVTQKSKYNYREIMNRPFHSARCESERDSKKKLKSSKEFSKEEEELFSFEPSDKYSKMLKQVNVKDERSSGISGSSETKNTKRKNSSTERNDHKPEYENRDNSKHKKAKTKHKNMESVGDHQTPSMSFESCLNYDVNMFKEKERRGVKKHAPKIRSYVKEETAKDPGLKCFKSPMVSVHSPKQKSQETLMDLMSIPLPALLPECEKPFSVEYFEKRVEKESDFCDVSKESALFTGQRLNRKMQVYSGAKTIFLPAMMSLYQQCIRTLQNNINLLYETGGVPYEILEPVLERCTPEQLLRIEECNPIYIGVTDHLWGKHCQRDFKDSKLQEYESWKEMYIRLSEERERKLQRLTKSIVSAHSKKPKGRQVKMAFIHTVAKPPRDVRIQQEIHGTAVQQPHQPRCSVKSQDNRSRQNCNELSRSSSTSSGTSNTPNTQDPRKKTRVAPMMAKSLKAFKKQLGRR